MADVLIRNVPDEVLAAVDARAQRVGLSRSAYLRRALAARGVGVSGWLIDKSALVRLSVSVESADWAAKIQRGLVRITTVTRLEVGYSARSGDDLRSGQGRPSLASMPVEYLTPFVEDRAVEVQRCSPIVAKHRAGSVPDLLIAAAAELSGLTLHLDKDFDLITGLTGQPAERLVLR